MPLTAIPLTPAVLVTAAYALDGQHWLETRIAPDDYAAFEALPNALEFQGRRYGKSGWNSDTGRVAYRTGSRFALAA